MTTKPPTLPLTLPFTLGHLAIRDLRNLEHVEIEPARRVNVIHGNNVGDAYMMGRIAASPANRIHYYGQDAGIRLGGRRIFLVHYPHYAAAMATTGDWDLVCCGHDHKADIRSVDNLAGTQTWLVNPGTVGGIKATATWVLGDLDTMRFTLHEVQPAEAPATRQPTEQTQRAVST